VVHLRSPRLPAETARAIVLGTAILTGGCEAVFGPPKLEESGFDSTGPAVFDPEQEDGLTTGNPGSGSDGYGDGIDDESADAEVGGGDTVGPAFDLGSDTGRAPPPDNGGECCSPGMGVGCIDDDVEACVCAIDPACCEAGWDELCAKHVEQTGCGSCERGVGTTDFPFDCCTPHDGPGCIDVVASACVCEADPFCCMVVWDQLCIDTGVANGCLACNEPLGPTDTDCCSEQVQPGCDDAEVAECVCTSDAYCCDTAWDAVCVNEVEGLGCGSCTNMGSTGDDGGTSGSSSGGY